MEDYILELTSGQVDNILSRAQKIKTSGDGTKFLNDAGEYITVKTDQGTFSDTLILFDLIVFGDNPLVTEQEVPVKFIFFGTPTHYRISESYNGLINTEWSNYNDDIKYMLSAGNTEKTVYAQIKNDKTESKIKICSFTAKFILSNKIRLTINLKQAVSGTPALAIPLLKYNKKFAYNYNSDDGNLGIYHYVFNYINKRYIETSKDVWHNGMDKISGINPSRNLSFTDGCGHNVRFGLSSAFFSFNGQLKDLHTNGNTYSPYLWWNEAQELIDFGGSLSNHGGGVETSGNEETSVKSNQEKIIAELNGYSPISFVVPGGMNVENYMAVFNAYDPLYMRIITNETDTPMSAVPTDKNDLRKYQKGRHTYDSRVLTDMKSSITTPLNANPTQKMWISAYNHDIKIGTSPVNAGVGYQTAFDFLDWIYDNYGAGGNDTIWFANIDEVFEYAYLRCLTKITEVENTTSRIAYDIEIPDITDFYYRDLSFLLSGIPASSISGVTVNAIATKFTTNYNQAGITDILFNIGYSKHTTDLAEKYVSLAEREENPDNISNAIYFMQFVSPYHETFAGLQNRINAIGQPPVLQAVTINSGASSTESRNITITISYTGSCTAYAISETESGLTTWINNTNPSTIQFTISNTPGAHTIYIKLKNANGQSSVLSDTINYVIVPFRLDSITINGGSATTENKALSIAFNTSGEGTPLTMQISETPDLSDVQYVSYTNPYIYRVTTPGQKTIYARVAASTPTGNVASEIKSASITVEQAITYSTIVGLGFAYNESPGYNEITKANHINASSKAKLQLKDTKGQNSYSLLQAETYTASGANGQGDVTGNDSGPYPDLLLQHSIFLGSTTLSQFAQFTISEISASTCTVKLFCNTKRSDCFPNKGYISVQGTRHDIPAEYMKNNMTNVTEITGVPVENGSIVIEIHQTSEYANIVLNVIEIIPE